MLLSANADLTKIEQLSELGYDAIDVGFCRVIYHDDPYPHNPVLDGDDYEQTLDRYIEKCKKLNLKIIGTHIPYRFNYADPSIENYDYYHMMTCRALRASEYLGAEWAVMHQRSVYETVEYVKRLFCDTGVKRIGIAIENKSNQYSPDELIRAHDILKQEGYRVGICLDTGHCHINGQYGSVADTVRLFGERIKILHVHDNCGNADVHRAVYAGTIDWQSVMKALADIEYGGAFNFELQPEKLPEPCRAAYEQYCVTTGKYLIGLFNDYRNDKIRG